MNTLTGKGVGFIPANRALIVGLLKSITRSSGSILFTLQLPCYAVYCCVCSMRTCHCHALAGSRWKARQCVTVFLKRGWVIRSQHVKMFWSKFSTKPSLTILSEIHQPLKREDAASICLPTHPVLTATACAWAVLSCATWLTACDVLHMTPTPAACAFHKLHFINHNWESARTEALSGNFGGSFGAC